MAGLGMKLDVNPEIKLELNPIPTRITISVGKGLRGILRKEGSKWAVAYRAALEAFARLVAFGTNASDLGTSDPLTRNPLDRLLRAYYCEGQDIRSMFAEAQRVEVIVNAAYGGVALNVQFFRTKEKASFATITLAFEADGRCSIATYSQ